MKLAKRRMSMLLAVSAAAVVVTGGLAPPAAAQTAAGQDGGSSDALITLVDNDRATYGGISFDQKAGTATIRYDDSAGDRVARARLGQVAGAWHVVLQPVRHSLAELDAVRQEVATDPEWRAVAGKLVSKWYIDVRQNRVAVGVTQLTPEVTQAAIREFGDLVSLHVAARPAESSRTDDFEPWVAGSRLNFPGGGCTGGYVIRTTATPVQRRLVSAGHCGVLNAVVRNNGDEVGTVMTRSYVESGRDFAFIGGRSYQPFMYTGGPSSNTGFPVKGTRLSGVGLGICTNGATTGENCAVEVAAIDVCVTFVSGHTTCLLDEAHSTNGTAPTTNGDSGGPVIAYDSAGLKVVGSIIGGGGTIAYFHSYHYVVPTGWVVDTM